MSAEGPSTPTPIPRREPRPWWVHWGVASIVVFLAIVVATSFFGARLEVVAVVSVCIGLAIAPFSRRAERRALAARD